MSYTDSLSILATILGLIATIGGGVAWYSSVVRKRYASERDFNHIREWQLSNSRFLDTEFRSLENRLDTIENNLLEMKILVSMRVTGGHNKDNQSI